MPTPATCTPCTRRAATGEAPASTTCRSSSGSPDVFGLLSCEATATWDCSVSPGSDPDQRPAASAGTPGQITFQRKSGPFEDQDHLSFTVHTPKEKGTYELPTVQKQSDGSAHHWDGGAQTPAPSLKVE